MIAVVTGAGRGFGRAIALELADRGCDVAVLGRTQERLASTAEEVVRRGRRALAIPCDVARSEDVDAATSRVLVDLGARPDVRLAAAAVDAGVPQINRTAQALVTHLDRLADAAGVPRRLSALGIGAEHLDLLASEAMKQERLLINNPCAITEADARRLYEAAL